MLWFGPRRAQDRLAIDVAWGSVAGAMFQLLVQLPQVIALMRRLEINFRRIATQLRIVFGNLAPVVGTKGVAQVSAYVDQLLASLLPSGAVAAINFGQIFYMLPVSLLHPAGGIGKLHHVAGEGHG